MAGAERYLNHLSGEIVDAAFKLHRALGPGLLESVYEVVLARDLERRGLNVVRQMPVDFDYDGMTFTDACKIDLFVESCVVVELKSVERLAPVHSKQLLTYLRLLKLPLGLLINFGAPVLREGINRVINGNISAYTISALCKGPDRPDISPRTASRSGG